jgi:hypothetical protein
VAKAGFIECIPFLPNVALRHHICLQSD